MINFGNVPVGAVLPIFFDSFAGSTGASVTLTGLAATDIEVYKGTSMTQRASDAGFTLLDTDGIDVDGVTGIHGFSIDTGDNTDASFYAAGSFYTVVVSSVTVDSQTVNFVAATFRLVAAETTAGVPQARASAIADNAIDFATFTDAAKALMGVVSYGTMQAGSTATTAVLAAATSFADDLIGSATIFIRSGTGTGQSRVITDWVSATDTATVDTWTTTPDNTSVYVVFATPPSSTTAPLAVNVTQWAGTAVATPTVAGVPEVDLTHVGGATTNVAALATNVDAILTDTAVIGAAGAGLTALATQASVNTIDDFLDTEVAAILAAVDTEVAAIKAKTDSLTFTVAGQVDANIQSVNDVTVAGDGSGTPWGP